MRGIFSKNQMSGTTVNIFGARAGVRLNNGTITDPSLSFQNERNTGIYLDTTSGTQMTIVKKGQKRIRIEDNGVEIDGLITPSPASFPDGTASSPSLSFNSDLKTGIFRDTSATTGIGFSVSGVEIADFDSNGLEMKGLPVSTPELTFDGSTSNALMYSSSPHSVTSTCTGTFNFSGLVNCNNQSIQGVKTLLVNDNTDSITSGDGSASKSAFNFFDSSSSGLYYGSSPQTVFVGVGGTQSASFTPTLATFPGDISYTFYNIDVSVTSPGSIGGTGTPIQWTAKNSGTGIAFSSPQQNLIAPVSGWWSINASILWPSNADTSYRLLSIRKFTPPSTNTLIRAQQYANASGQQTYQQISYQGFLNANEGFFIQVQSGATLTPTSINCTMDRMHA